MIARIIIPLLLFIVLPDVFFELHYFKRWQKYTWWKRLLWWLPAIGMFTYSVSLACVKDFVPHDTIWLEVYLFLFAIFIVPKVMYSSCLGIGWLAKRYSKITRNWGKPIGILMGIIMPIVFIYGLTKGFSRLEIKHIDLTVSNLPESFDGYRIVHFSDAHVGTFSGSRKWILKRDIDSINAQSPDLIVFTGDLQNESPRELYRHLDVLLTLKANDGIYSILGNHDYSKYVKLDDKKKRDNEEETQRFERGLNWHLLMNQNKIIKRGNDSIYIAGVEFDDSKPSPFKADVEKTVQNVPENSFLLMLCHNPSQWDSMVLPKSNAQVTFAGHTHGGQVMLFGIRPTMLSYKEDYGLFEKDGRYLEVTSGIGGVVPFRFGASPEIVVVTLHRQ